MVREDVKTTELVFFVKVNIKKMFNYKSGLGGGGNSQGGSSFLFKT